MSLSVAVYVMGGHRRSTLCADAMKEGIRACGDVPETIFVDEYRGPQQYDVCVFYGYRRPLQRIMRDYKAAGKPAIYIDLGYWGRVKNNGYHKIVVNGRHPTEYFQKRVHDDRRLRKSGIEVRPWRESGDHILLAGMGAKAAVIAENMRFESFERDAIAQLRRVTDRPIIYRPKPSCRESGELNGTIFSPPEQSLSDVLKNCHAVVTHHSNVAVDAIVHGVPAFCLQGVAVPLALQDFSKIETPVYPDDAARTQWLRDISYTQWTWTEMAQGLPWRHLKSEGLIP